MLNEKKKKNRIYAASVQNSISPSFFILYFRNLLKILVQYYFNDHSGSSSNNNNNFFYFLYCVQNYVLTVEILSQCSYIATATIFRIHKSTCVTAFEYEHTHVRTHTYTHIHVMVNKTGNLSFKRQIAFTL